MRKLQDVLRKHLLREALDPIAAVHLEKPVAPLDEQRIDAYCELRADLPPPEALPHLGLVRRMAEVGPRSMVEQFSETPSVDTVDDLLRKKHHLHHSLKKTIKGTTVPKPVLWVVSPSRPDEVLADYVGLPLPDWPSGFYRCAPGLTTWVVVLAELPKRPETRLLRMFGPAKMQLEVLHELRALPTDDPQRQPWVDILAEVRYLIEKEPDPSPEEYTIMTELRQRWEREKADLRREGQTQSKAEAILTVMAARGFSVSERVRTQIMGCHDLSVLERWLARAVTAPSENDVIAA
jgi:hypothetical protein